METWALPVVLAILIGLALPRLKTMKPPKKFKVVLLATAFGLIFILGLLVAVSQSLEAWLWTGGSITGLGVVMAVIWPCVVFWILVPSLPSPKTPGENVARTWFIWSYMGFTVLWLAFAGLGVSLTVHAMASGVGGAVPSGAGP